MDKNLYHNMRVDFQNRCREYLGPKLRKYEAKRLTKLEKLKKGKTIVITLNSILAIVALFSLFTSFAILIYLLQAIFIISIVYLIVRHIIAKNFEIELKQEFLNNLCKCFGELEWFDGNSNQQVTVPIEKTCLFKNYNRTSYDDTFIGKYKDVDFKIIEIKLKRETGSGKDSHTEIIFDGAIIKISMNKKFNSHTVIRPHKSPNPAKHLKRTVLEDVVFENKYDVYTTDEIDARYLITTAFMERLNNIQRIFSVQKVSCAFYQKDLYIALYTNKDLFKLFDLNKPINNYEQLMIFFNEVLSIYKCIDYFKLSEKTGL